MGGTFEAETIPVGLVNFDGQQFTFDEFADVALTRYPCDDPFGDKQAWRLSMIVLGAALIPGGLAALLFRLEHRGSRHSSAPPLPPPMRPE